MLESVELDGFPPETAKLILAFAIAVQQSGMPGEAALKLFQTALEIYSQGYVNLQRVDTTPEATSYSTVRWEA